MIQFFLTLFLSIFVYELFGMENYQRLSPDNEIFDNVGLGNDLQISYKGEGKKLEAQGSSTGYATNVPFISPYGWSEYVSTPRMRRAWITFNVRDADRSIPNSVKEVLETTKNANIIGNIIIFGVPQLGNKDYPKETNMRLHG